jgi:transcriptional regulator with XRE-family HTH domain
MALSHVLIDLGTGPRVLTTFGQLLRCYRIAAGLTQEELAERAGLSGRGVQDLERLHRSPYAATIRRLAKALELTESQRTAIFWAGRQGGRSGGLPTAARPVTTLPESLASLAGPPAEEVDVIVLERLGQEACAGIAFARRHRPHICLPAQASRMATRTPAVGVEKPTFARSLGFRAVGHVPLFLA